MKMRMTWRWSSKVLFVRIWSLSRYICMQCARLDILVMVCTVLPQVLCWKTVALSLLWLTIREVVHLYCLTAVPLGTVLMCWPWSCSFCFCDVMIASQQRSREGFGDRN